MPTFPPLHQDLTFLTPLSERRAQRLVDFLTAHEPLTALDVGCGWAELLLRVLDAAPSASGLGIDLDEESLVHARRTAETRRLAGRATFEARDAREVSGSFDALTCIGASQIWGPDVEEAQPIDYTAALTALRAMLLRGGRLVYGEGIWSAPPTPAAVAPLAGRVDEFITLGQLVPLAESHGFGVMAAHEASLDEWDVFESGFAAGWVRWLTDHESDDPEAEEVRALVTRQHEAYLGGYRGILGFAYLHLVAL
jgi:cyclopropane fatty-acyl-phospholipid synthase-like methyltransferase